MIEDYYGDVKPEMVAEELTGTSFDEHEVGAGFVADPYSYKLRCERLGQT